MIIAGLDVGALTTKSVLLADGDKIVSYSILPNEPDIKRPAQVALGQALGVCPSVQR